MWNSHPECKDCIKRWWSTYIPGTPMFQISQKLDLIKRNVWGWNKNTFRKKKDLNSKLTVIQECIDQGGFLEATHMEEASLCIEWKEKSYKEELY